MDESAEQVIIPGWVLFALVLIAVGVVVALIVKRDRSKSRRHRSGHHRSQSGHSRRHRSRTTDPFDKY